MAKTILEGMQTRTAAITIDKDSETGTVRGIGVPYGEITELWPGIYERFAPGSVQIDLPTPVIYQHADPVGRLTEARQTDSGVEISAVFASTDRAQEVRTLVNEGVLPFMSIGFRPGEFTEEDHEGGTLITHTKARATEFSLVHNPAYRAATVEESRSKDTIMTDTKLPPSATPEVLTRSDLDPINEALTKLERRSESMPSGPAVSPLAQYRSMGDYLKAIVNGDENAIEAHRAYTGATTADTIMKDTFLADFIRLVTKRRRIVNKFTTGSLPSPGLSLDYYQLDADDTKVGKQAKEGDDLPYGSIKLKSANAPVDTYGGYTELSRQAIERATVPALNITMRALGLKYAQVTETAARAVYLKTITDNKATAGNHLTATKALGALDLDDILSLIVDAVERYEDTGFAISGLDVSKDVFLALAKIHDGNDRILNIFGQPGNNSAGTLDVTGLKAGLASISVEMIPGAPAGTMSFYDETAIETLESPGAPAQLQDENIINLTKRFSLYGYAAQVVPFPSAIVPVKFAGAGS